MLCGYKTQGNKIGCQKPVSAKNNWQCGTKNHPPRPPQHTSLPDVGLTQAMMDGIRPRKVHLSAKLIDEDFEEGIEWAEHTIRTKREAEQLISDTFEQAADEVFTEQNIGSWYVEDKTEHPDEGLITAVGRSAAYGQSETAEPRIEVRLEEIAEAPPPDDIIFDQADDILPSDLIRRGHTRLKRYGWDTDADLAAYDPGHQRLTAPLSLCDALLPVDQDGNRVTDEDALSCPAVYNGREMLDDAACRGVLAAIDFLHPGRSRHHVGASAVAEFEKHENTTWDDVQAVLDYAAISDAYTRSTAAMRDSLEWSDDITAAVEATINADKHLCLRPEMIAEIASTWSARTQAAGADMATLRQIIAERYREASPETSQNAMRAAITAFDDDMQLADNPTSDERLDSLYHTCLFVLTGAEMRQIVDHCQDGNHLASARALGILSG